MKNNVCGMRDLYPQNELKFKSRCNPYLAIAPTSPYYIQQ